MTKGDRRSKRLSAKLTEGEIKKLLSIIHGDVKVSTGILNCDKHAALRERFENRILKITDKNTVAFAA